MLTSVLGRVYVRVVELVLAASLSERRELTPWSRAPTFDAMKRPWRVALAGAALAAVTFGSGCTPVVVTLQQHPTTPDAVGSLRGGSVVAVYGDYPAMAYAARESAGTLEVVHRQFQTANFGIAVKNDATALRDTLTAALAALGESGRYNDILRSWALDGGQLELPEPVGEPPEPSAVPQLEDGVMRVGMDISFAPMGFRDETGEQTGVDIQLAEALAEQLGVELELVNMEFDALFPALDSGEIDAAISAITVTPERADQYGFIEYMRSGSAILVQSGNPEGIEYPAQLCGRSVAVQEGTIQLEQLQAMTCY